MEFDGIERNSFHLFIESRTGGIDRTTDRLLLKVERDDQLHVANIDGPVGRIVQTIIGQFKGASSGGGKSCMSIEKQQAIAISYINVLSTSAISQNASSWFSVTL